MNRTSSKTGRAGFSGNTLILLGWIGIILVLIIIHQVGQVDAGSPRTFTVDDDGEGDYGTIQEAVDAAVDGDTIRVWEGTYYENVFVDKSVNLIGNGSEVTIIDGGGIGDVVNITADRVNMSGFRITGSGSSHYPEYDSGIRIESDHTRIFENDCSNNQFGIYLSHANHTLLSDNLCSNNDLIYNDGIFLSYSNFNLLSNNICSNNDGSGIFLSYSNFNILSDNTCSGNNDHGISLEDFSKNNTIDNNICDSNNQFGISLETICSTNTIINNTCNKSGIGLSFSSNHNLVDNNTVMNSEYGVFLMLSDNNTIIKNSIKDNDYGIYLGFGGKNNIIGSNTIENNDHGISLDSSFNNTLTDNRVLNNDYAIFLRSFSYNNNITNNLISQNRIGIYLNGSDSLACSENAAHDNEIFNNNEYGISFVNNHGYIINATNNWWGNDSGPYHPDKNPDGTGDNASDDVDFDPWIGKDKPPDNCTISGYVRDIYTRPIEGVHIEIGCWDQYQANTSKDGSYSIENIPCGTYCLWTITFSKPGYIDSVLRTPISGDIRYDVLLNHEPDNPRYTGSITGYIFDEEGNPIEFARIGIRCSGDDFGTTTNISGFYGMSNLPNGDCYWTVNVSKAGFISQEIEMQISENSTKNFTLLLESPPQINDDSDPTDSFFPLPPIVIFSMSAGSVVLILVAFTEFGRYAFFSLLYPLYTRLSKDKLLENYTRGRIHGLIEGIPGIHYSELLRKLAVGNGNLAYHLKTLEREGIIRTKRIGKMKRFYLSSDPAFSESRSRSETTIHVEATSITENPTCTSILKLVESNPGLSESEISDLLGIPKQTVNYHIRGQEIAGNVRVERENGNTQCYLKK